LGLGVVCFFYFATWQKFGGRTRFPELRLSLLGKYNVPVFDRSLGHRYGVAVAHGYVYFSFVAVAHPLVVSGVIISRRADEGL
jgi:hypothetical protein